MATQLWSTGPALIYVAPTGSPLFLGTAEQKPQIDIDHVWVGAMNDIGGTVPLDESYQGSQAFIRCDLTRWDEDVLYLVRSVPNPAGTPGSNPFGDIGTLALTEGVAYPVFVRFPYVSKAAYSGMTPGYKFGNCILESEVQPTSIPCRKFALVWRARRAFGSSLGSVLYNHDVQNLPAIA